MTVSAVEFLNDWISENINAEGYSDDGSNEPDPRAKAHVQLLLAAAKDQANLSREDFEKEVGNLEDYISEKMEEATDREVKRLADKDP